jgi:hypothetical protein
MTQVFVPLISGNPFTIKRVWRRRRRGWRRQQLIEAILKKTLMDDWLGSAVLNNKKWAKLKKYRIIMSKLTDRYNIFVNKWNMK